MCIGPIGDSPCLSCIIKFMNTVLNTIHNTCINNKNNIYNLYCATCRTHVKQHRVKEKERKKKTGHQAQTHEYNYEILLKNSLDSRFLNIFYEVQAPQLQSDL